MLKDNENLFEDYVVLDVNTKSVIFTIFKKFENDTKSTEIIYIIGTYYYTAKKNLNIHIFEDKDNIHEWKNKIYCEYDENKYFTDEINIEYYN